MTSDCEDGDFWESWISPVKRKRKKNSQKDKKCVKRKNPPGKTDESSKKKKKKKKRNSGFKEAMGERKEMKKEKKGKKHKSSVGFDDSFLSTQGFSCAEPEPESPHRTENVTEDSRKKTKRKKKVAFALSPGPIAIKRPKCASSSSPKESIAPQRGDGGGCSLGTGPSRPHDNDSQGTSDDINSQDLFITQKTFRTSPVESSSGEACGNAPTQPERRLHPSPQGSNTRLHESCSHQRPKETKQQTPVLVHPLLREEEEEEEEEEGLYLTKQISKKEPLQTEVNTNLTREKKPYRPRHVKKIRGVNPFLDDAVVLKSKTKTHSGESPSCPLDTPEPSLLPQKSNTSTQTENFFTAELSSFLNFCLKSPGAVCFEDLKPLDLSLPQRARNQPGWGLSGVDMKHDEEKTSSPPDKMSSNGEDAAGLAPSRSSDMKKEPSGRQQRKVKATPSPQSESDPKSTDTTTSSEDNEATGKLDMTQVRAVQMRLNESFFFKAKGDGRSHRPESPLMKLAQGREMKSRKSH